MSPGFDDLKKALADRYEIEREIGEGGMATVYLARDLKHNRSVAVKVLKPELAAVVGAERFLAEIETTANLQHPHILPLFDSGEADSFLFYVMPYIDGETLRDRLDREKQLPVDEAIGIATAVANALHTAHEAGVIHRDIKPGNILMSQGQPLVSDFGIALAVGAAGGNRLTETGLSVGTPYYMSPEQATGDQQIGPQSDIYALACVLYEMLTGEPPYTGATAQAVLGKIIMGDPVSATAIRSSIPANVDAAIRRALEKLPADRFTGAQGFARALGDSGFQHGQMAGSGAEGGPASGPWNRLAIGFAALAALALVAAVAGWMQPAPPVQPSLRTHLELDDLQMAPPAEIAISPDGSRFVLAGEAGGVTMLYLRNADEERFRPVPGTEGADFPAFSPKGEWVVFVDQPSGGIARLSVAGGAPRPVVTEDLNAFQPYWGDDGTIVFWGEREDIRGIYRVADAGGDAVLVLEATSELEPLNPRLLPGGRTMLATDGRSQSVVFFELQTDSITTVVENGIDARYLESGHLLYADVAGGLWAVAFDPDRGETRGQPIPVLEGLSVFFSRFARYDISDNGTLVYAAGGSAAGGEQRQLAVVDMQGNEDVRPLAPRAFDWTRWSPDGASVAYQVDEGADGQIFTYNVELGTTPKQVTFEGNNNRPVWSPDGTQIAFMSFRNGTDGADMFVKTVTDDSPPEMLLSLPGFQAPYDWPTDDQLAFQSNNGTSDLWIMDPADSASARPYLESEAGLFNMRVSPSGDLAAYQSRESGISQIFVRSFPTARQPVLASQGRGDWPHWSSTGDTLYYWKGSARDSLFALRVQRNPTFSVVSSEVLLGVDYRLSGVDIHPSGDRWIALKYADDAGRDSEETAPERFVVVTNWFEELRAALGN